MYMTIIRQIKIELKFKTTEIIIPRLMAYTNKGLRYNVVD